MAGIAGIQGGDRAIVKRMLSQLSHRGDDGSKVIENDGNILGAIWPEAQTSPTPRILRKTAVWDTDHPPLPDPDYLELANFPFSMASSHIPGELFLARDTLGISPLYYGYTADDQLCFASEVKALLEITSHVTEFPPNTWYTGKTGFRKYALRDRHTLEEGNIDHFAQELLLRLEKAVCDRIRSSEIGAWLSGGLDSSAIVALVRPHVNILHTFAAGLANAPDLVYAEEVANYYDTQHHAIVVTLDDILAVLPEVIYHLESFDALLVRSSITNYLVAKKASEFIDVSFSGEGADELFAGYAYLKQMRDDDLDDELDLLTGKLHNTALQRVDRSAAAHGLVVHVPFLDPEVVAYAQGIPAEYKLKRQPEHVEKFILRQAMEGILPDSVLWRRKAKFWQGTGMGDLLSQHAEERISQVDFDRERSLPNGWVLNTKEELLYYRIFKDHFNDLEMIDWMGRTKGAPKE